MPDWLEVVPRPFPSSTMVVIRGPRPIVVDPGAAADADLLPELVDARDDVATVVCSHYHSDHVGAVAVLQNAGARVLAHEWDAAMVNARDPQTCAARWLDQPVLPYRVDQPLEEGDTVSSGAVDLHVLHTPGHTLGGISLWEPESRTLICGDALHADDIPWIGNPHEGAGSLQRARLTLDRIEQLAPALVISGHGPPIDAVADAIERTRTRFAAWDADPLAMVQHAAKRIFIYRLMLEPIAEEGVRGYLSRATWARDLAASVDQDVEAFAARLLDALRPSLTTSDGLLRTTAPHRASPSKVPWHLADPARW